MQGSNGASRFVLRITSARFIHPGFWNCIIDDGVSHELGQPFGFDASIPVDRQAVAMQTSDAFFQGDVTLHELKVNIQLLRIARNNIT